MDDAERARRDSSYNHVVIEFKAPGLFQGSDKSPAFIEAMQDRLLKYIVRLAALQGLDAHAESSRSKAVETVRSLAADNIELAIADPSVALLPALLPGALATEVGSAESIT